jgi:hypothetical protein
MGRQRDRQTERQRDRETEKHINGKLEICGDRQMERQRDGKTVIWWKDREMEKQRDGETERFDVQATHCKLGFFCKC